MAEEVRGGVAGPRSRPPPLPPQTAALTLLWDPTRVLAEEVGGEGGSTSAFFSTTTTTPAPGSWSITGLESSQLGCGRPSASVQFSQVTRTCCGCSSSGSAMLSSQELSSLL